MHPWTEGNVKTSYDFGLRLPLHGSGIEASLSMVQASKLNNHVRPHTISLCKSFFIRNCILWTVSKVYAGSVHLKYKTFYISRIHYRIASLDGIEI